MQNLCLSTDEIFRFELVVKAKVKPKDYLPNSNDPADPVINEYILHFYFWHRFK